jgi:hypothetical protein
MINAYGIYGAVIDDQHEAAVPDFNIDRHPALRQSSTSGAGSSPVRV